MCIPPKEVTLLRSGPVTHRACPTGGTLRARPYAKAVLRRITLKILASVIDRRRFILSPLPVTPYAHRASSAPSFSLHRRRTYCATPSPSSLHRSQHSMRSAPILCGMRPFMWRSVRQLRSSRLATSRPLTLLTPHAPPIGGCCGALLRYALSRRLLKSRPGGAPSLRFGGVRPTASP